MDSSSNGQRKVQFYKNNAEINYYAFASGGNINHTGFWVCNVSMIVDAVVSDYFEVIIDQNSGGPLDIKGNDWVIAATFFSAAYLGA